MSLVIAWNLVTRSRQGSAPPRRRQLKLPTLADILIHEVLSGGTAAQEWSTDVRPLEQLAILAFWPISEKGEDCLCGTIPESRTTFRANLDAQAVRIADSAPSGSPVPGTDHSAT